MKILTVAQDVCESAPLDFADFFIFTLGLLLFLAVLIGVLSVINYVWESTWRTRGAIGDMFSDVLEGIDLRLSEFLSGGKKE